MKKIPSLFQRNYDGDRLVRDEVVPGSEWVLAGEGKATVKFDGTSCLYQGGKWFKRYDAKNGKAPPVGFVPAQEADEKTGHWPGWVPVVESDKWHCEGIAPGADWSGVAFEDGQTYELCGPQVQGNPEGLARHWMIKYGCMEVNAPRDFDGLKIFLCAANIEGIVFHHPDGRMVKIKTKDFGLKRQ